MRDVRVRAALDSLHEKLRPTPDAPDFAAGRAICPAPPDRAPTDAPVGLILETRRHRNLPFVVRQVVERCRIPVQLMHGPGNRDFVHDRLGELIAAGKVIPTALSSDRLNGKTYNGLFLNRRFWEAMIGRGKILTFQTDSMLCRGSAHTLADFLGFDFIGSRRPPGHGCGLVFGGGNGGLSVRDWAWSVRVLDRYQPERWRAGEDDFFPLFLEAEGANVARAADSDRFCGQRWFERGCFGLHKPNFRKLRLAAGILRYEPGAWRLLSPIEKRLARG